MLNEPSSQVVRELASLKRPPPFVGPCARPCACLISHEKGGGGSGAWVRRYDTEFSDDLALEHLAGALLICGRPYLCCQRDEVDRESADACSPSKQNYVAEELPWRCYAVPMAAQRRLEDCDTCCTQNMQVLACHCLSLSYFGRLVLLSFLRISSSRQVADLM
ncbi:hypothetical protein LX32DRAFT_372705 [Colletotrichum zoysiae]|uniref:Uncharacterized protein n=1 Tax=Colletotrichum zoysiae TaxID=1216348 RepID=A0AAD9HSV9_9PEZI|nr:hypothetical protein LX32DRAFT_372705 [Colletotrichum zoysiae]